MDKDDLQKMYVDFLIESGYEPELEDLGDVRFNHKNLWMAIEIWDEDLEYGRLCSMNTVRYGENSDMVALAYNAASIVNSDSKLTKIYIRDIYEKTGINIGDISEYEWEVNTGLSQETKDLMKKHGVAYSATAYTNGKDSLQVVINYKAGNIWYLYSGCTIYGHFLSQHQIKLYIEQYGHLFRGV
jgi:hypothetical protein